MAEHTNRLINESSPYLRQHAHNPVDWYPWGEEALSRAQREKKPVLLSIGYSACHWCHVMAHESFENEETARLMNEHFINIKVDREERPDLDHVYMSAVQMLTGGGGWPLTVFLTPDGKPFYGGTYFPPQDRGATPSFPRLLQSIVAARRDKPEDVEHTVEKLMAALRQATVHEPSRDTPAAQLVRDAVDRLAESFDPEFGGIGTAPKFPNTAVLDLFLCTYRSTGDPAHLQRVVHALTRMAEGGIYDQLGGGFHRYSVDRQWLVPHFEKMLYDNAQLVQIYLAAYQISGDLAFATIARETLDYVLREMRDRDGGFYTNQDADSESGEGTFFLWDPSETREILGEDVAQIVCRYWDITETGNFNRRNVLHIAADLEQLAVQTGRDYGALRLLVGEARARMFAARARRPRPPRDEKILTSWNGLMISAFAKAAELFGEEGDRDAALAAVAFVREHLQDGDRLFGSYQDGKPRGNGFLDDYAFFIGGLLDVFEAVQDSVYLAEAVRLAEAMLAHFWDDEAGGFFFTADDHEQLIVRSKPAFDGSIPSGNSAGIHDLLRLFHLTGETRYLEYAEKTFRLFAGAMREQPYAFANMLRALDFHTQQPHDIVLVGTAGTPETDFLLEQIRRMYLPNRTLRLLDPEDEVPWPEFLRGKTQVDGKPTAYVCRNFTCSAPATSWLELEPLLSAPGPRQP